MTQLNFEIRKQTLPVAAKARPKLSYQDLSFAQIVPLLTSSPNLTQTVFLRDNRPVSLLTSNGVQVDVTGQSLTQVVGEFI